MSQTTDRVEDEKNGAICAVVGSGMRVMSDSLIAFQPAMDEPSNMMPSAKTSSSTMETSKVTCCHLPRGSVKRKSTYLMSLSLIALSTSLAVFMVSGPLLPLRMSPASSRGLGASSDRGGSGLARADGDGLFGRRYENLAVADPACLGRLADRLDGAFDRLVVEDDLKLHLRQEVDHVLRPAVEFGMALLSP